MNRRFGHNISEYVVLIINEQRVGKITIICGIMKI